LIQAFADNTPPTPATLVSVGLAYFAPLEGTGIHCDRRIKYGGISIVKNPEFRAVSLWATSGQY